MPFATTSELKALALQNAGEPVDGSSDYDALALDWINDHQLAIVSGGNEFEVSLAHPWSWAKSRNPGIITLVPPYSTGTVTLTQDDVNGTFDTAPDVSLGSLSNRILKLDSRSEFFIIATHAAGAGAFTLDQAYTEESGSFSFKAYQLDYDTPSTLVRLISPMRGYPTTLTRWNDIALVDFTAFQRDFPMGITLTQGMPTHATILSETDGTYTLRFNRYVDRKTRIEFEFIPIPATLTTSPDTTPLLPLAHRRVLADMTTFRILNDKKDTEAKTFYDLSKAGLQALIGEKRNEVKQSNQRLMIAPRFGEVTDIRRIFKAGDYFE